jgi:Tfp pilus assembly protein PilF
MIGFIINCIAVLFFISAGLLLVYLISLVQRHKGARPRPRKRIRQTSLTSAANPQLQSRLLQLLNGDSRAAARLIRHARQQNPGRSESWCLEKAIFDLERDRH